MKKPYVLEVHAYAPELNKAFRVVGEKMVLVAKPINGLLSKSFASIKEVRSAYFAPIRQGVFATIKTHYEGDLKWLERTYRGYVGSRAEALEFAKNIRAGLTPEGSLTIKTELVG